MTESTHVLSASGKPESVQFTINSPHNTSPIEEWCQNICWAIDKWSCQDCFFNKVHIGQSKSPGQAQNPSGRAKMLCGKACICRESEELGLFL